MVHARVASLLLLGCLRGLFCAAQIAPLSSLLAARHTCVVLQLVHLVCFFAWVPCGPCRAIHRRYIPARSHRPCVPGSFPRAWHNPVPPRPFQRQPAPGRVGVRALRRRGRKRAGPERRRRQGRPCSGWMGHQSRRNRRCHGAVTLCRGCQRTAHADVGRKWLGHHHPGCVLQNVRRCFACFVLFFDIHSCSQSWRTALHCTALHDDWPLTSWPVSRAATL